jgi:hypothetical protein
MKKLIVESYQDFLKEAKNEIVKVNFGDAKQTESSLDYIIKYGKNYAIHPRFGITHKENGEVWFEINNTTQRRNLDDLVRRLGGQYITE